MERKKPATYQDIVDLPEWKLGQIVDGELFATRTPLIHSAVTSGLQFSLPGRRRDADGWWILFRPEFHWGEDVIVPDLCGWRRTPGGKPPFGPDDPFFTTVPDWVCEVVMPDTAYLDRARKLPVYARERVQHVWLLDAEARTLEVLRLGPDHRWVLQSARGEEDSFHAEPFERTEVALSEVWGPYGPHATQATP